MSSFFPSLYKNHFYFIVISGLGLVFSPCRLMVCIHASFWQKEKPQGSNLALRLWYKNTQHGPCLGDKFLSLGTQVQSSPWWRVPSSCAILLCWRLWLYGERLFFQTLKAQQQLSKECEDTGRQPGQTQHSLQEPTTSHLNGWEKEQSGPSTTFLGSHKADCTERTCGHIATYTQ